MKIFKYTALLIGLVICFQGIANDQTNSLSNLNAIEKTSNYRVILVLSFLAIIGYCNHQKILLCYKTHPVSSLILSYLTGAILIDTYTEYKIVQRNLSLLKTINQIYFYLKSALLLEPDEEKCFTLIKKHSLFSVDEIEKITQMATFDSLKCLNCTCTSQVTYQCPNVHQLMCRQADSYEIITEIKDYPDIYKEFMSLEKNKTINKDEIFEKIGKKINKKINFLIKNTHLQ